MRRRVEAVMSAGAVRMASSSRSVVTVDHSLMSTMAGWQLECNLKVVRLLSLDDGLIAGLIVFPAESYLIKLSILVCLS